MVPCDVLVPRAKGTCVSPDGGVARPGATVTAVTTPASPTPSSAHLTARFMLPPFRTRLRQQRGWGSSSALAAQQAPPRGRLLRVVPPTRVGDACSRGSQPYQTSTATATPIGRALLLSSHMGARGVKACSYPPKRLAPMRHFIPPKVGRAAVRRIVA